MTDLTSDDLERSNIPPRYWTGVSLANIPATAKHRADVFRYFKAFDTMQDEGVGLYLWSKMNGTGKTAIACVAAMHALARGRSAFYYRSEDLKEATIQRTPFVGGGTVYDRARDCNFLVLDDIGKEYKGQSGFVESVIENLLRERIQRMRTTFITSNLDPATLRDVFTVAAAEVMKEAFVMVRVADPDEGGKLWREEKRDRIRKMLTDVDSAPSGDPAKPTPDSGDDTFL